MSAQARAPARALSWPSSSSAPACIWGGTYHVSRSAMLHQRGTSNHGWIEVPGPIVTLLDRPEVWPRRPLHPMDASPAAHMVAHSRTAQSSQERMVAARRWLGKGGIAAELGGTVLTSLLGVTWLTVLRMGIAAAMETSAIKLTKRRAIMIRAEHTRWSSTRGQAAQLVPWQKAIAQQSSAKWMPAG